MNRRVVVTGVGLVSPVGMGTQANWDALCAGTSGIGPITRFDAAAFSTRFAGEVKNFDPLQFIEKKELKKMDIFIQFAVAAAQYAIDDAEADDRRGARRRASACSSGRASAGSPPSKSSTAPTSRVARARSRRSSFRRRSSISRPGRSRSASAPRARTWRPAPRAPPRRTRSAIRYEIIKRGAADAMITGGTEAAVCPMGVGGFAALRALSQRNDDPTHASRPFDKDRDGFVLGEGAGIVILEELEMAQAPRRAHLCRNGRLRHVRRRLPHDRAVGRRRRRRSA